MENRLAKTFGEKQLASDPPSDIDPTARPSDEDEKPKDSAWPDPDTTPDGQPDAPENVEVTVT